MIRFFLFLLVCSTLRATNWYVDASASPSGADGTISHPWISFATIVQSGLTGDDVVWVKSGTYDERFLLTKGGTSGHRITYVGYGGSKPVLRGVYFQSYSDIAFIGFRIDQLGSSSYGYTMARDDTGSRILFENNDLVNPGYITTFCNEGLRFRVGSDYCIVRGNYFDMPTPLAVSTSSSLGNQVQLEGDYCISEYNHFARGGDKHAISGQYTVVRNNYMAPMLQSDLLHFNYSDLAIDATDNKKCTSAGRPFTSADVNGYFYVTGGTGFTAQHPVTISSVASGVATVDKALGAVGSIGGVAVLYFDPHIDDLQLYQSHCLYERNFSDQNDTENGHFFLTQDQSHVGWNQAIVRQNVVSKWGGGGPAFSEYADGYAYNNTFVDGQNQASSKDVNSAASLATFFTITNTWRNNTFLRTQRVGVDSATIVVAGVHGGDTPSITVVQDHNNVYPNGLVPGTGSLQDVDPQFQDETALDFRLKVSSPLKAAGGAATTTVGAGVTSTSLTVVDAKYFFDGYGVVDADWIKIGSGAYVQISSVNYGTNVITLASSRSWSNGDNVIVLGMEDIGALPYNYAKSFTTALNNSNLINGLTNLETTVNNPEAVRKVEYLIDGIPTGVAYAAPYTVTVSSDGAAHTVEARAYSLWASRTLWVSDVRILSASTPAVFTNKSKPSILSAAGMGH